MLPHQVGFAAAFYDTGAFLPGTLAAYITCACLVIAWLNLSNDAWVRQAHHHAWLAHSTQDSPLFPRTRRRTWTWPRRSRRCA